MPPSPNAIRRSPAAHAAVLAIACAGSLAANASFVDPPRYDGAGYAVLARSILSGRGYREIDRPDAPRHAHFPPGYPLALAALWGLTGPSEAAAHALSFACTLGATLLAWAWFRSWARPGVALSMGLALAVNWQWGRSGAAIRSEPPFLLLGQAALLASPWVGRRGGGWRAAALGVLLGASILTRHVGVALTAALCVDLWMRGRRREVGMVLLTAAIVLARWIAWLVEVPGDTQVELVPVRGLAATVSSNGLFYLRRLIDQILGPVIEVATVFRPEYAIAATILAAGACLPIVWGWMRLARRPRSRAAGLVPASTMALLLIWPFTEAGRFLVPLVPFLIAGLVEGLAAVAARFGAPRPARRLAAWIVLAASLPYSAYAIAARRADAERATHRDFDAACAWIAAQAGPPGPVLSRHPGEVHLRTGRLGISPGRRSAFERIEARGVAFVLDDDARFRRDPPAPPAVRLREFADAAPGLYEVAGAWGEVVVYRALPPKPD